MPTTTSVSLTGAVMSVSIVPLRNSSDSNRIVSIGKMNTRISGMKSPSSTRSDDSPPGWKFCVAKKMPETNRKMASRIRRLPTSLKAVVKPLPMAWPRMPPLPCGYQEHEFSAMTEDGREVRGLLKFNAVGCTP